MNLVAKSAILLLVIASVNALTPGTLSCCPASYIYDRDTLTCVCPPEAKYRDAQGNCVTCKAPSTWDPASLTCQKCRAGQTQNGKGVCVCPRETPFDNGKQCVPCPEDKPVWNGKTCVACPSGTHFDIGSKTCTVCPEGLTYSPAIRRCDITN